MNRYMFSFVKVTIVYLKYAKHVEYGHTSEQVEALFTWLRGTGHLISSLWTDKLQNVSRLVPCDSAKYYHNSAVDQFKKFDQDIRFQCW